MRDYIEEEKLYRVYRKKDNHISRKINEDGMIAAIQFSDDENALNGPVLIKPVEEEELVSPVYTDLNEARSFKQIIIEEVITPSLQYALEYALEIGFEYLSHWAEEVAIPKAKKKSKELWKEVKIIMSGVKDGLAGKETKASQLLKECERMDLLLEEKNHDLLDEISIRMLTAFKEGNFIVNGEAVPISNYVYK